MLHLDLHVQQASPTASRHAMLSRLHGLVNTLDIRLHVPKPQACCIYHAQRCAESDANQSGQVRSNEHARQVSHAYGSKDTQQAHNS